MAALAGDLSKAILGQSDAAKAFRPWWDVLEDNLLYSFVIFGKTFFLESSKIIGRALQMRGFSSDESYLPETLCSRYVFVHYVQYIGTYIICCRGID